MLDEKLIAKHMKSLNITREEAIELIREDEEIDRMTKTSDINSDLTDEQKKVLKESTKTGTKKKPTNYKFDTKSKKKDDEKISLVAEIHSILTKFSAKTLENCIIANENREITFTFGENEYSLVLTKHRTPKK